MFDAS